MNVQELFTDDKVRLDILKQRAVGLRWAGVPDGVIPLTSADPDFVWTFAMDATKVGFTVPDDVAKAAGFTTNTSDIDLWNNSGKLRQYLDDKGIRIINQFTTDDWNKASDIWMQYFVALDTTLWQERFESKGRFNDNKAYRGENIWVNPKKSNGR